MVTNVQNDVNLTKSQNVYITTSSLTVIVDFERAVKKAIDIEFLDVILKGS